MNSLTAWIQENRTAASLAAIFIVVTAGVGYLAYSSWSDYQGAFQNYQEQFGKLTSLNNQSPFPSEANLTKLRANLSGDQKSYDALSKKFSSFTAPVSEGLEKAPVQDRPQVFQDILRAQVTKMKNLSVTEGATLPPGFYLGMEEFENRVPSQEEALQLDRELSVATWITSNLIAHSGMIIADFTRVKGQNESKVDSQTKPAKNQTRSPQDPLAKGYQVLGTTHISFRCDQSALSEFINALSSAPYFLVIENLQLQNTATEPPRRDGSSPGGTPAGQPSDASASQKLPLLVGRESVNVDMTIKILEFPTPAPKPASAKPVAAKVSK